MRGPTLSSETAAVTVAGAAALLLLGVGLRAGGAMLYLVAGALAVVAVFVITAWPRRFPDLPRRRKSQPMDLALAGLITTCAFAFFAPWEGFYIAGQRPRFVLLVLAVLLLLASTIRGELPRPPWWILALAGTVVLVAVLTQLRPISQTFFDSRYSLSVFGGWLATGLSDLGTAGRMLLTVIAVPLVVMICAMHYRRAVYWIAISYVAGNAVSALAAYTDYLGLTTLAMTLTGQGQGDRAPGFASHPVLLTFGTVSATAIAVWLFTTGSKRDRILGAIFLPALILGTYASRTRGGVLGVLLAIALSVLILRGLRRHLHLVALGATLVYAALFVVFPSAGHSLLVTTRLIPDPNAQRSTSNRIDVIQQGLDDFLHSPIHGIGLHVFNQAHNSLVQVLAAGGLILLVGFLLVQVGALTTALRLMRAEPLAAPLAATMLTRFVYDILEGTLITPVVFMPIALIAGLTVRQAAYDRRPRSKEAAYTASGSVPQAIAPVAPSS